MLGDSRGLRHRHNVWWFKPSPIVNRSGARDAAVASVSVPHRGMDLAIREVKHWPVPKPERSGPKASSLTVGSCSVWHDRGLLGSAGYAGPNLATRYVTAFQTTPRLCSHMHRQYSGKVVCWAQAEKGLWKSGCISELGNKHDGMHNQINKHD